MGRVPWHRIGACSVLLLLVAAAPQPIGSWLLDCPTAGHCVLRHRSWIVPPGSGRRGAALEVQRRGDWLVPVVTLQGLTTQMAVGGLLALHPAVTLRFDSGSPATLSCGLGGDAVTCAPRDPAAAAAALAGAASVRAEVVLSLPGGAALPPQSTTLALAGTDDALARLRSAGAAGEALPAEPGLDWIGFLDKLMRAAGFADGTGGLVPRLVPRLAGR